MLHIGGHAPLLTALAALLEASLTVHATYGTLESLRDLLDLTTPGVEGWLGARLYWAELTPGKPTAAGDAEITPFMDCLFYRPMAWDRSAAPLPHSGREDL
jgi:hypothetical protein